MSNIGQQSAQLQHPDRFFIRGRWQAASSDARIQITSPATEERFFDVAAAQEMDIVRAVKTVHNVAGYLPGTSDEYVIWNARVSYSRLVPSASVYTGSGVETRCDARDRLSITRR